jgi:flagellar motility protein MotE (MotC chaperone)
MGAVTTTDDLLTSVESLVPVLTVGLHEVVRQASHTCRERGIVLERIWTAYVALFGRVLTEMKALLDEQRRKTHALDGELGEVYRELERLRHDHPQHLKDLITHLEDDYKAIQTHLEDTLNDREEENNKLSSQHKAHIADVSHWYPHFSVYQNSTLKNALPTEAAGHLQAAGTSPEVAIADDFKRMVAAFPPDTRRAVGRNLSHVFDDHSAADEATLEALKADLAERTAEVAAMQQKVRELEETRAQLLVSAEVSR